jgi:DNA-binding response OmpR family regulator
MAVTTPRERWMSRRADVVRTWTRSDAAPGSLAVLDADLDPSGPLVAELRGVGVRADVYDDHLRALVRMGAQAPDVVVAGPQLPGCDLPWLVRVLRAELSVPVLLAFGTEETDRIGPAVAAGALPVLSRPYRLPDLLAALHPHWPRRSHRGAHRVVGDLALDVEGYDARLGATRIDFTPGEFELVTILAEHADHVVLRDQLTGRLWPSSPDPHAALVATVARIRRKLAAVGAAEAIRTVRGLGYRIESAELSAPLPQAARPHD